jgi:sorbitol/mannitol transport system substrate-binding protein
VARNAAKSVRLVAISVTLGLAATGCAGWGGGGGGADSLNVLMVNNPQMIDLQS